MTTSVPVKRHEAAYRSRAKFWIHVVLILGSVTMIFPFIWMFLTSNKTQGEAFMHPPKQLPSN